jgi:hypothetical protein
MPSVTRRKLKTGRPTTTTDNTLTPIMALPVLPANGSFSYKGTVIARNANTGAVVAFFPFNSGTIISGTVTQSGGGGQAAPCKTAPSDGGATQGFAPPGVSSNGAGNGLTVGLALNGNVGELVVTGIAATTILWCADLDLTLQSN